MAPQVAFYQVNAFTNRPFSGNPAGVFLSEQSMDPRSMQLLAREMGLSETAFVGPPDDDGVRPIRWFTPAVEVSLCGHASLAAAHILSSEFGEDAPLRFVSASGPLQVEVEDSVLSMAFQVDVPEIDLPPSGLLKALGVHEAVPVLRADQIWIVRLAWQKEVEQLTASIPKLLDVDPGENVLGVAITAPAEGEADFVSRFFAPWIGVPEDPVTGVAHTALAPYWGAQLDKKELLGRQISAREGIVHVRLQDDQVILSGEAVTVARGEFLWPDPDAGHSE